MRNKLILIAFFVLSSSVFAWDQDGWDKTLKKHRLKDNNQCFCFKSFEDESIQSSCDEDKQWSIASLTKLVSAQWLLHRFGLKHEFETKFYLNIKKAHLHISGAEDPIFYNDIVTALIIKLNKLGIKKLNVVSFDSNFVFSADMLREAENKAIVQDYEKVHRITKLKLLDMMNTWKWNKIRPAYSYSVFKKNYSDKTFASELPSKISLATNRAKISEKIPFEQIDEEWSYKSHTSKEIISFMNTFSRNGIPDFFYSKYKDDFHEFVKTHYQWESESYKLYNGSGLPFIKDKKRFENKMSCSQVLEVIEGLENELQEIEPDSSVEEILATPQTHGTLNERFDNSIYDYSNSLYAKTGTIYYVSALAGTLNTKNDRLIFASIGKGPYKKSYQGIRNFEESWMDLFVEEFDGPLVYEEPARPRFFHLRSLM